MTIFYASEVAQFRILLVDDDPSVLAQLHGILTTGGYDVTVAKNGREAHAFLIQQVENLNDRFQGSGVDLIITDIAMPELNGDLTPLFRPMLTGVL
ncbi:MAG TPA: response regulator [Elusimicrobiota bacterium]|nr:response regulator [Elusimicrobiota bacterium]